MFSIDSSRGTNGESPSVTRDSYTHSVPGSQEADAGFDGKHRLAGWVRRYCWDASAHYYADPVCPLCHYCGCSHAEEESPRQTRPPATEPCETPAVQSPALPIPRRPASLPGQAWEGGRTITS